MLFACQLGLASVGYAQAGCPEPPSVQEVTNCLLCDFTTIDASTEFQTASASGANWCGGSIENDQYFGFVVNSTGSVEFEVSTVSCSSGVGIQVALFDQFGDIIPSSCDPSSSVNKVIRGDGLVPGAFYTLGVDGFSGAICNFTVTPIRGIVDTEPDPAGPISGPAKTCWGTTVNFSIDPVFNATGYYWELQFGPFTMSSGVAPSDVFDPLVGSQSPLLTIDLPQVSPSMPTSSCDTIQIEVFPINLCSLPDASRSSATELVLCRNAIDTVRRSVCLGSSLEYPPGSGTFYGPDDYFAFTSVSLGLGPPDGCEQFEVLVLEPTSSTDTLSFAKDTAFCSLADVAGFTEEVVGSGLYYLGRTDLNGCAELQPYQVVDLAPTLQQLPSSICRTTAISSLFDLLPLGIQGTLLSAGGTVVDTATIPPQGLPSGRYQFAVAGLGCVSSVPITIPQPISFSIDTVRGTFSGGVSPVADSVYWFVNGIEQSRDAWFSVTASPGMLLVVSATAWNACDTASSSTVVVGPRSSSTADVSLVESLSVWPNPTHGQLHWAGSFEAGVTPLSLNVYDHLGRLIKTSFLPPVQDQEESLSLFGSGKGTYRLVWTTSAGVVTRAVDVR